MNTKPIEINNLKVSIVTPSHNSEIFISETIESVLSQTYQNWEMLITDDCSSDNTLETISNYAKQDPRIKLFRLKKNSGSGVARNNSINAAAGQVIAFLDADDLWDSDFLRKSIDYMEQHQAPIVFSSYRRVSEDLGTDLGTFIVPQITNYHEMLKSCSISCLTGMYHIDRCHGKAYMPEIRKRQDYCLWLTLLKRVDSAYGLKDVLATYRIRSGSVSRNKFKTAQFQWHVYRSIEKLSLLKSLYYFTNYATKGLVKNYQTLLPGLKKQIST